MAYVPNSTLMFTAAFAGALAGMGASGRQQTDPASTEYAGLASVAGAFAQAFDTVWGLTPVNQLDIQAAEEMSEGVWKDRSPQFVAPFTSPSNYLSECAAIKAMIQAGEIYFAGQAIIPPPVNGVSPGTNQVLWEVNSITGLDTNPGTTALPLKTVAEFTRRVTLAKYSSTFGPYSLKCQNDIPITDSFQWSPNLLSDGAIPGGPFGISGIFINIFGTKTVIGAAAVAAFSAATNLVPAKVTRAVGAFVVGDVIEFTSGASNGKRSVISDAAGAVGSINEETLGGTVPAALDTFNLVSFTKWSVPIQGVGGVVGAVIRLNDIEVPSTATGWEVVASQLTFRGCVVKVQIQAGNNSRVRYDRSSAVIFPVLDFLSVFRGTLITLGTTFVNVVMDIFNATGRNFSAGDMFQNGCVRVGESGADASSAGLPAYFQNLSCYEYPSIIPLNLSNDPYPPSNGTNPGAAIVACRGSNVQHLSYLRGNSANAGTSGLNISEAASFFVQGATPTATGAAGDIIMDGGAVIPVINPATGVPAAGAPLTSWTGAGGWDDPATYNKNAMNLANGTRIVKTL